MLRYLDGWKTKLGAVLIAVAYGGESLAPEYAGIWQGVKELGLILTGAGLGHKAMKG